MAHSDPFGARTPFEVGGKRYVGFRLAALEEQGVGPVSRIPYSIRVLLESVLRNHDGFVYTDAHVRALAGYDATAVGEVEVPFMPGRVVLQDFTGVPAVVDLAALRAAMARMGGDVSKVNPLIRADLVVDHSVVVDAFGSPSAIDENTALEFSRNRERYRFLKWGQGAFDNFTVVPPATGIVHQVNLEYLASVALEQDRDGDRVVYPDSLVGTDSHTTMINGLGVVGWGVGGIEAEACMLGQPIYLLIPEVVGFELTGRLKEGVTATDLVLTVTQMLRKHGVVSKFVEFTGSGLDALSLADRATIANMAPEYGATMGYFPPDERTIEYLRSSGRPEALCALVEAYCKHAGLWRDPSAKITYSSTLSLDLGTVEPSLAGPKRPQDRIALSKMQQSFLASRAEFGHPEAKAVPASFRGQSFDLRDGAVTIAAITSCTNTSNPDVMVAAGLVARKAHQRGLVAKPWVKTSLAPGSRVVTDYLDKAGLTADLDAVGFYNVGYGCTTCIAEGTPVLQAHGTARRIETLPSAGGAVLMAPDSARGAHIATQREAMPQGERECVALTLQDGRTLVCTPDHEILTADGRWVRADALDLETDRVVVGLEAPVDEIDRREEIFALEAGDLVLTMKTPQDRLRTLAFARLLGHLLGDGSISTTGQARVHVGQAVDRELVLDDVELLAGKRPAANAYDERKWTIVLPKELASAIAALPGVTIGRVIDQTPKLPAFVLEDLCPVPVVREFLGGVFGADGHAPCLHRYGDTEQDSSLTHPAFSQTARPEHVGALEAVFTQLTWLLERCGVDTSGHTIRRYGVRRSESSYAPADGAERVEVRLQLTDGLSFVERVGYRYCVDKALKASAAAAYWRMIARIGEQRTWMADRLREIHAERPDLSFTEARRVASAELRDRETVVFAHYSLLDGHDRFDRLPAAEGRTFRPLHREACGFPAVAAFLEQLGVRSWFAALDRHEDADYARRYCVDKEALSLPTFALGLLDRRPVGTRRVFDIAVDTHEAFFAGTVAVHNCIGNSGPLPDEIRTAVEQGDLVVSSVLSGNRNFEGRVSPHTRVNYLASPPLVVAYALAGTVDIDLVNEPLGTGSDGEPVYLRDIWPSNEEVHATVRAAVTRDQFVSRYADVYRGPDDWQALEAPTGAVYAWAADSTYIQEPPFFVDMAKDVSPIAPIRGARVLAKLGTSVTTDHISPAGNIGKGTPAERYLLDRGVAREDFNSYGSRRGNDQVMTRGTFANIRIRNALAPGREGGFTTYLGPAETPAGPTPWLRYTSPVDPAPGEVTSIYDASVKYQKHRIPLVVLAGRDYGMGSSRDWAAKGVFLLGVRAVIAESYERIHRSNLVGMGVLPLQFIEGQTADSLGLTGHEVLDFEIDDKLQPLQQVTVRATRPDGTTTSFSTICRIDTPVEVVYYRNGGILHTVLRRLAG